MFGVWGGGGVGCCVIVVENEGVEGGGRIRGVIEISVRVRSIYIAMLRDLAILKIGKLRQMPKHFT